MSTHRIIKQLDAINFHDLSVDQLVLANKNLSVEFENIIEDSGEGIVEVWTILFSDLINFESSLLVFDKELDLEIHSFDYEFNKVFECKLVFLLGLGNPAFEVSFKCSKIELVKMK